MTDAEGTPVPHRAVVVGVIPDQPPRVLKEAARYATLFGAPLMIHRPKLEVILAVLGPRIGLAQSAVPANPITSRTAPTGATGIAVLPIYGTLVRRTVGLEA